MYLNPTGANPTGTILPEDRRREIYNLAVEHDMLIIEDDPYYYLQVGKNHPLLFDYEIIFKKFDFNKTYTKLIILK